MSMICLVRHGETDWNKLGKVQGSTDIPLNERGIRQAQATRDFLAGSDFDLIVASPMKRARKTADILNEALQLPLVEMEGFVERGFGEAEGLTRAEREAKYPSWDFPGMESWEELVERVMLALQEVNAKYGDKKVLLVCHGAVISAILSTISNGEIDTENTHLVNACLSNIQFIEEKWKVHDYNLSEHLANI
ncbi:histidine phosphatase family protein [Terribacillus saccharophilus]|uniref:histidine phosphatase family protein n=1 Tax=Terribacillus saccharophilus TaxID=361277 RepID=UPI002DD0ED56|nr:histidine phosphatase family protein [Terribacillus saccharophilus]